jgi:alanine dehydrogenase
MSKVLVIKQDLVKELVSMSGAIEMVEQAFLGFHQKKSKIYPAVREMVEEHNGIFGIKSAYLMDEKCMGLKAGGFWNNNVKKGKTNHQSTMVLFDAETGEPVCLLDANYLTGIRTGAAGAVAAKYLARKDSKTVGIIGAGVQSRTQLEGLLDQFPIEQVLIFDRFQESAKKFEQEIVEKGLQAHVCDSPETLAGKADIIVTTTPSFSPVLKTSWVKEGTHINAMGSDTKGKRELDIDQVPAKRVCDLWEQSSIMGECQHGTEKADIHAEIGQIVSGERAGRENEKEFDGTGIAVQDLQVAAYVYSKAKEKNLGVTVEL